MNKLAKPIVGWRRSTHCVSGECLEVRVEVRCGTRKIVVVRDNKDAAGPQLDFSSNEWCEFVGHLKVSN
jgi:hypothetical protein